MSRMMKKIFGFFLILAMTGGLGISEEVGAEEFTILWDQPYVDAVNDNTWDAYNPGNVRLYDGYAGSYTGSVDLLALTGFSNPGSWNLTIELATDEQDWELGNFGDPNDLWNVSATIDNYDAFTIINGDGINAGVGVNDNGVINTDEFGRFSIFTSEDFIVYGNSFTFDFKFRSEFFSAWSHPLVLKATITGEDGPNPSPAVPEPSTWLLLGSGLVGTFWYRKKQQAQEG